MEGSVSGYPPQRNPWIPAFEGVDKWLLSVMPAKAGIPNHRKRLDSRFHGNDEKGEISNKSTLSFAGMTFSCET